MRTSTRRTASVHREHKVFFYAAHGVLIVANLVMAVVLARIGLGLRRRSAAAEMEIFRQSDFMTSIPCGQAPLRNVDPAAPPPPSG